MPDFTQGEWKVSKGVGAYAFTVSSENKYPIARIPNKENDAHLIAAAPEMYEALKNLTLTASYFWDKSKPIKDTDNLKVTHPIIEQAKQALAKAEGKEA